MSHGSAGSRIGRGVASRHAFPAGTQLTFVNSVAPVGWTRVSTFDDAALRIVGSATPSSGGSNGFSTVMAQTTVGNTTLAAGTIPAHTHPPSSGNFSLSAATSTTLSSGSVFWANDSVSSVTGSTGSGGAHNHAITLSMKYVDALIAKKN